MNYKRIYEHLVERGQKRLILEGYKEVHHIIPRCMGGKDEVNNLVNLTPEEHFIAHQLLVKIYPNNMNLWKAVKLMTRGNSNQDRSKNKMYGWLKRKVFYRDSRINCVCKLCNKGFKSYDSAKRVYCGTKCRKKLGQLRSIQVGKKEHTCNICNKAFLAFECSKRKFCSKDCKYKNQIRETTLCCKGCEQYFKVKSSKAKRIQYCSPKCSKKWRYIHAGQSVKWSCPKCNKELFVNKYLVNIKKYCNRTCQLT